MSSLVIPLVSTTLPTCNPNLMPFHIDYDGPAPVSAFMRVSPLKQGDLPSQIAPPDVEGEETAENASADAMNIDSATAVAPAKPSSTIDASTSQSTDVDMENATQDAGQAPMPAITWSNTESTLVVESQASSSTSTSSTSTLQQPPAAASPLLPVLDEIEKRVVSSFRGRTIHGLSIDLPLGYSGLVLESEGDTNTNPAKPETKEKEKESEESTKGKGKSKAKAAPKASSKPRGRLARSAASKKPEVIEIEDEDEEMPEASTSLKESQEPTDDAEPPQDAPSTRSLVPKAQFSSFTLWHADRPVEKTRDEYFRTLEEWIALSHEIHRTDITFED